MGRNWMGNTSGLWRRRRSLGRRLVLVTGEGFHQLTAQEISQFGRRGLKPIVIALNNLAI
jgi:TPP-dependent 2-oxoacid decarboxylase